jgi:hypothetical protein
MPIPNNLIDAVKDGEWEETPGGSGDKVSVSWSMED